MGMRVGSGGGGAAIAQMQMAQMTPKPAAPAAETMPSPKAALTAQNTQMQSILSLLRGQGGNVDMTA
jgi:hypothetical protein